MIKTFKYRLLPNNKQIIKFAKTFGCCRLLYNSLLGWYCEAYETWKNNKNNGIQTNFPKTPLVTEFKKQYDFLKEIDALALMNARENYCKAIDNFFTSKQGKRKGKRIGFPKFKKKGICKNIYKTNNVNDNIRIVNSTIKLPKIGFVKFIKHRPLDNGQIKSVTIEQTKSNKYYIMISVDVENQNINSDNHYNIDDLNVVGLDMSLSNFIVSSNPNDSANTNYVKQYRKDEKKLKMLSRRLSKKTKGSNNRDKARRRLAVLHNKISNRRKDYCIKQALYYARNYDVIMLEDINLQDISKTLHLGKSVSDLGFGIFRSWLAWQAYKHDSCIIYIDKWYASSKTCHNCGYKNKELKLSDREWVCPKCGVVIDRDYNASLNIRDYFYKILKSTAGTAETDSINYTIKACGDNTSALAKWLTQVLSVKQEASQSLVER